VGNKDPILTLLKEYSYTAVRLPRTGIAPLQVLQKQGNDLIILGELRQLMEAGPTSYPQVSADKQAGFINGKSSSELKLAVGLSMLGNIIGAMTGTKLKLNPAFGPAKSITYEFDDVMMNDVNQIELSRYLAGAKLLSGLGSIETSLEEGDLFVITSIIKSRKFTASAQDSNGAEVPIDVEVLKGMAGGSVNFKIARSNQSKVTFEGSEELVFGIQAAQIEFEDGKIKGLKQIKPTGSAVRGLPSKGGAGTQNYKMLDSGAPFVQLSSTTRGAALKKGSSGREVRNWQAFLISKGYLSGKPTSVFDDATHNATIAFQKDHSLGTDGVVGPGTLAQVHEITGKLDLAAISQTGQLTDLTEAFLKRVMPAISAANLTAYVPFLKQAMTEFEINTPARVAAFLAQLAHESGQFRFMAEIWGPTENQKRYEPPSDLARDLGNTMPGDGKRFKGRGPIQITGRSNYKRYGDMLNVNLIDNPDRASDKDIAFRTAGAFWKMNSLNQLADRQWYMTITKRVNGGFNGLEDRVKHYERALNVLGVSRMRDVQDDPADDSGIPRFARGLDAPGQIVPTAHERNAKPGKKAATKPTKKAVKKPARKVAKKPAQKVVKKAVKKPIKKAAKKAARKKK